MLRTTRCLGAGLMGLALTLPAAALPGPSDTASLSLDKALYAAGELATITVRGTPGHVPIMIFGTTPGPTVLPGVGELGVGLSPFPGLLPLEPLPPSGEILANCAFDCESGILRRPCFVQIVTIDPKTVQPSAISNTVVLTVTGPDCGQCPAPAEIDPVCGSGSYHALTFPGMGDDYVFVAGGNLAEQPSGTAVLTGLLARLSDPGKRWLVDIRLSDRVDPGAVGYPPAASPKEELCDEAYAPSGGPIHPGTWHYYETLEGTLYGMDDYEGAVMSVEGTGPPLQVGYGANGKNLEYGASAWLDVELLQQPLHTTIHQPPSGGDINVTLGGECVSCPGEAEVDSQYGVHGGHALWLPDIGTDFVFEDDALFVELDDGSASLQGTVRSESDPDCAFEVEVTFAGRINPGSAGHPPASSPKQELDSSAYAPVGPVDVDLWHYYLVTEGTLTGLDKLDGAVLAIERAGPAFQVGRGASGKNAEYGASGWLEVELVSQPVGGVVLPADPPGGDFNLDLGECP